MVDLINNILRGGVSSVMYVLLLFTLTKSRFGNKGTIIVAIFVFVVNMGSTIWFYLYGDLTSLSRFTIILFLVVGFALKPLAKLSFMQWCFTFLTTINIAMMIIILSFHLGKLFPMPQYANTLIRLGLYVFVIVLFQRHLLTVYRSILSNWPVFSLLVVCIFLNLSYYFYVTDDIQNTLSMFKWPLYLLVMLSVAAYGTVFYALKQFAMIYALEAENMKFQHDTGLLYEAAMKLEKIANYDTLTGLPNRRYFFERLEKVTEESTKHSRNAAIVFIDLDGFKAINDTFGHEIGDGVLTTVGDRLMKCLRKTDFVARIGGDEFAIIIEDIEEMKHAENLAHKIHTQLQEIMYIDNVECSVNASIGIALYPESGSTGEILLRNADFAMYEIKRQGKGGIGVYTNAMR